MHRTKTDILILALFLGLLTTGASAGETPNPAFHVREGVPGDSTVGADTASEITWTDRLGKPRTVQFVTASRKFNPGWLSRYVYDDPSITVNAVDGGSGGLTTSPTTGECSRARDAVPGPPGTIKSPGSSGATITGSSGSSMKCRS